MGGLLRPVPGVVEHHHVALLCLGEVPFKLLDNFEAGGLLVFEDIEVKGDAFAAGAEFDEIGECAHVVDTSFQGWHRRLVLVDAHHQGEDIVGLHSKRSGLEETG